MIINKNYQRGRRIEYKIIGELIKQGFVPIRSAGSHSIFDCIGIREDKILFIQSKRSKGKYYSFKKEIKEIKKLKVPKCCSKELWVWKDYKGWKVYRIK